MTIDGGSLFGVCTVVTLVTLVWGATGDENLVTTKQGTMKGHLLKTHKEKDIFAFQGIPYAKPPLGQRRFQLAEPAESWAGVLDATREGPACIQNDILFDGGKLKGAEDCLFLNVYTPNTKPSTPFAVLVWIHGGGWFSGSGSADIYGPGFLLDKEVVLVTINYRLGALGFVSTGDSECPGNNGLKDQTLALKWVQDNIEGFGGDPRRVTIAGQSAGGGSTQYHMTSPMSRGLFHSAITQSGSSLGAWAIAPKHEAGNRLHKLATLLNCPTGISAHTIECLRKKDAKDIVKMEFHFKEWGWDPIVTFRPVVEGQGENSFIPEEPLELLKKSSAGSDVPWMVGLTSAEGALHTASIISNSSMLQELNKDFHRIVPLSLLYRDTSPAPHLVTDNIREFYFQNRPITVDRKEALVHMYSDAYFLHPIDSSVRLASRLSSAPVFYYYFDFKGPGSYSTLFGDPDGDYGVCHCDELQFLFPHEKVFPKTKLSQEDLKMVDILTSLWTNFVKHGNPTPPGGSLSTWDPVRKPEVEYLHIGPAAEVRMSASLLQERTRFWASLPVSSQPYNNIRDEL